MERTTDEQRKNDLFADLENLADGIEWPDFGDLLPDLENLADGIEWPDFGDLLPDLGKTD